MSFPLADGALRCSKGLMGFTAAGLCLRVEQRALKTGGEMWGARRCLQPRVTRPLGSTCALSPPDTATNAALGGWKASPRGQR